MSAIVDPDKEDERLRLGTDAKDTFNWLNGHQDLEVYSVRWLILIMFVLSGVANALVLLSFSPVIDLGEFFDFLLKRKHYKITLQ